MNLNNIYYLWQHSFITVMQIECITSEQVVSNESHYSRFLFILSGTGTIHHHTAQWHIDSPTVLHVVKGELCFTLQAPLLYIIHYDYHIHYIDSYARFLENTQSPYDQTYIFPLPPPQVLQDVQQLYQVWQEEHVTKSLFIKYHFYAIVSQLLQTTHPHINATIPAQMAHYIHKKIHTKLTIQQIASNVKLSERHALRLFQRHYNMSIQAYIQHTRLEKALAYIQQTNHHLKDIGKFIGIQDEYYFSRWFKAYYGCTPSALRLNYTNHVAQKHIDIENHFHYSGHVLHTLLREGESSMALRNKLALPFLITLMMMLGACQNSADENKDKDTAKKEVEMVTITDDSGRKVEIPAKPERVITDWHAGQLLAVGVKPVMGNMAYNEFLASVVEGEEIEDIGTVEKSLERILALKPDLIITWDPEKVANYEKIAPTVVFGDGTGGSIYDTPQEEILAMGKLVGRIEEAEAFNKDFEKRIAAAKATIFETVPKDSTFSLMRINDKAATVIGQSIDGGRALYKLLELTPPQPIETLWKTGEEDGGRFMVSFEVIGDYFGDYAFVIQDDGHSENLPPTWDHLDMVKNNEYISLDGKYYFTSDPLSSLMQVEDMTERLVAKVKEQETK